MVDPRMLWGTDDVSVDVIMVWAHGYPMDAAGERMRSGWTLCGLPMDAPWQPGNYQVLLRACFLQSRSP